MKKLLIILSFLFAWAASMAQSPMPGTTYPLPYNNVVVKPPSGLSILQAAKGNFTDTLFLTPNKVKLLTGTNGYVWTSDANGNMSLQPATGGATLFGVTDTTQSASRHLNQNGYPFTFNGGTVRLINHDSIGAILNYAWNQNPLNTWIDHTNTATVTTDGVSTTVSGAGLGLNLNNSLSLQRYVGVWNYTITGSVKIIQKDATSYGFMINIPPSTGMGTGVSAQFLLQQSQGFISYNAQTVIPDSVVSSKGTCKLIWALNDIIDVTVQRVETYFVFTMTNRSNGSQCSLTVNGIFPQVGQPAIYFYSPTQLVENFRIIYNESYRSQIGLMGNSIASGGVATTSLYKYFSILQDKAGAYGINLCGPGELSLDGTLRVGDMLSAHSQVLLYGYGVNDYSNSVPLDSFSKRVQRTIVPAIADGQTVVIVNLTPQTSGSLVTYNDTLQAIATRYSLRYVDIFTLLKGTGTAMNPIYDGGDGVHPNNAGHAVIASAIYNKISDLLTASAPPLIGQFPLDNNIRSAFVTVDENNIVHRRPFVVDTAYIANLSAFNTQTVQTGATFNITGSGAVGDNFIVRGVGGSFGAPIFSANDPAFGDNIVRALTFKTQNFYSSPGSLTGFDAGLVRFSSGAYIDALTQPFVISNRNHNSTSGNTILTNLDNGFDLTNSYQWLMAYKIVSGIRDTVFSFNRSGGLRTDTTSGYKTNINGLITGLDWITKDYADSVYGGGGGGGFWALTGISTLTGNTTIDVNTRGLHFTTTNSAVDIRDNLFSVEMTDGLGADAAFSVDPSAGITTSLSSGLVFVGGATDSSNYAGESYVQKDWVLNHIANAVSGGGFVSSVSGTSNRITSTGGTTPVIDISASYVGQSSITTLGTIGTGVWQGTLIAGQYGGTGVANTGKTITLGGNLTTSGAFASTFTMTNTTTVTFPTTGTLVNTAVTTLSSLTSVGTITTGGLGTGAVIGGVTMTLGSDAANDIYYRNGSGVLTRLANGTTGQYLAATTASAPSWGSITTAGLTVGTSTITSGTTTRILYDNAGVLGEYTLTGNGTVAVMQIQPSFTTSTRTIVDSTVSTVFFAVKNQSDTIFEMREAKQSYSANNTLIGRNAGKALVPGYYATGGYPKGAFNLFIGTNAGQALIEGNENTIIGENAGSSLTGTGGADPNVVGALNTIIGANAGQSTTTAEGNVFIGQKAGQTNTTGSFNVYIGKSAGALNITGGNNTYINAGRNATGSNSILIGALAGQNNQGDGNVLIGNGSYAGTITAGSVVAIGNVAGASLTSGGENVFVGGQAGQGISTGPGNTFLGYRAATNATGTYNTIIGNNVAVNLSSGSNNIGIGQNIEFASNTASGQLNITNLIFGTGATGSGTTAAGLAGILTNAPNSVLHVNGSFATGYVAKTGTYTATINDYTINCTSGTFQVTLPTAVGCAGRIYEITNSGAGTITVGTTSSQTFANVVATPTTLTMAAVGSRMVQSNGANWLLLVSL